MHDECTIKAFSAQQTHECGQSLTRSVYTLPLTIALTGELGSGKTTFVQGFAQGLGIRDSLGSPTYALEQRYASVRGELIHLDLYRLSPKQAQELLLSSESFSGIRCIEWSERIDIDRLRGSGSLIHVHIEEGSERDERIIQCRFHDAALPARAQINDWRSQMLLPEHINRHCDTVAAFSLKLGSALIDRGQIVRLEALRAAALLHDLFRFLDFRPGGHPDEPTQQQAHWEAIRTRFPGLHHEPACAAFLREEGFSTVADIVTVHGLTIPPPPRPTVEQKLLYYADKRVMIDRVVTLQERFADFARRYSAGKETEERRLWLTEVKEIEAELFPEGVPF